MTGIFCYHAKHGSPLPRGLDEMANRIAHRGRLAARTCKDTDTFLKIFVNKPQEANKDVRPRGKDAAGFVAIDGEIANEMELRYDVGEALVKRTNLATVLLNGYRTRGPRFFSSMRGPFSLVMKDAGDIVAVKDPVGANPLYIVDNDDAIVITSELKIASRFDGIPVLLAPGHAFLHRDGSSRIEPFQDPASLVSRARMTRDDGNGVNVGHYKRRLFTLLHDAVARSISPGCTNASLLSGGIDSAIICALAAVQVPELDVYTVAFQGSSDLEHARLFVERCEHDLRHHVVDITFDDMLRVLPDVVSTLETFDAALIRSAVPMHFLCSKVDGQVDVLLTGEGGDELFGGYAYLQDLTDDALEKELVDLLKVEHATGLQRVDRIPYGFGIEARAPWFDLELVRLAFELPASLKVRNVDGEVVDKWIERETFKNMIPSEIACRPKAKFSAGAGTEFILRDHFDAIIDDDEFEREKGIAPGVEVKSKEELHYYRIFQEVFDPPAAFVKLIARTSHFEA